MKMRLLMFFLGLVTSLTVGHEIICETSEASPFLHHIDMVANKLREIGSLSSDPDSGLCFEPQAGDEAEKCSETYKRYSDGGGAALQFCSGPEDPDDDGNRHEDHDCADQSPGATACADRGGYTPGEIADFVEELLEECEWNDRAGGRYLLSTGGEIRVIRMPG